MAFFKNIKRALGFSENDDADDYKAGSYQGSEKGREPYINPFKKESSGSDVTGKKPSEVIKMAPDPVEPEDEVFDDGLKDGIPEGLFDGVIDVLNSSMPGLVKNCIDEDAQKKYLYNMLGESFTYYVRKLQDKAVHASQVKWDKERAGIMSRLRESEEKVNEADKHRDEARNQFLSLERQKRAVSERVHDLEARVASLESEIEQYQLENKSLLNKLKVSQVKGDDIDYFKKEIAQYQAEVNSYKKKIAGFAEVDNRIAGFEKRIEELAAENETLKAAGEKLDDEKLKLDVSNSLVTELNERIRATEKENDNLRAEVDELREKIRIDTVELQSVKDELNEANSGLEIVAEIQAQLDKVEDMKNKKDAKIAGLSVRISELEKERDELAVKVVSFNNFIKDGGFADKSFNEYGTVETATAENEIPAPVNETIEDDLISFDGFNDLGVITDVPEEKAENPGSATQKDEPLKISAIDDSLDDIDWLIPSPPNPAPEPEPEVMEEVAKPVEKPADPAQMTLF